jgi:uncharacterized protein YwlG (UPF0340 family)
VNNVVLQPGMYQVQHIDENGAHVIVFKEVGMQAGYKMGNTPVGKEVARVTCKVEPATKKVSNTKIITTTNTAGERQVEEVQVAGENVRHILPAQDASGSAVFTGKKGQFHLTEAVKVGGIVLQPGMYQVQHVEENSEHVMVFKEVGMQAGYKMGNTPVGKEVVRVKCKVEPVTQKVSDTKITLRTNTAGERELAAVQVAGEVFKHVQ